MPSQSITTLLEQFSSGSIRALARCISLVENESPGYREILSSIKIKDVPVIGITGPPGAGKSTLINAVISELSSTKKIAVVAVDPTSPFNFGALLGDRIRMQDQFQNDNIYIRSMASRGSLGGLSEKAMEVTDVLRAFGFDYVFVETVGVGQSEVEIAGIADTTVVVLVPEAGDHIQTMKAGLMEIADIFVVNKADRPDAEAFANELSKLVNSRAKQEDWSLPVLQTIADKKEGIEALINQIKLHHHGLQNKERKLLLLAEKAYRIIQARRMKDFDRTDLLAKLRTAAENDSFNLYNFIEAIE